MCNEHRDIMVNVIAERDKLKADNLALRTKLEAVLELDECEAECLLALVGDRLADVVGKTQHHQVFCEFWGGLQDKLHTVIEALDAEEE